jgi:hypothetical protein
MLLDENLPRQVRSVRNIEVHYRDLFPLLNPGHKLPSPALNAFGAIIQDVPCEQSHKAIDNTLVLSSWIPALATGDATPARAEGSIIEHVQAAVSVENKSNSISIKHSAENFPSTSY